MDKDENQMSVENTKNERPVTKKGRSSWKPANLLELRNKNPNFRYYWAREEANNIAAKQEEGWEIVDSKKDNISGVARNALETGSNLDTVIRARGMVLMRTPVENSEDRRAHYQEQVNKTVEAIASDSGENIRKAGVRPHGRFEIT